MHLYSTSLIICKKKQLITTISCVNLFRKFPKSRRRSSMTMLPRKRTKRRDTDKDGIILGRAMRHFKLGVVGAGRISRRYIENQTIMFSRTVYVVEVVDATLERASQAAEYHCIPRAFVFEEVLTDSDIDILVNLTPPAAHYSIRKTAVEIYLIVRKVIDDGWIGTPIAADAFFQSHGPRQRFHALSRKPPKTEQSVAAQNRAKRFLSKCRPMYPRPLIWQPE